MFPYGGYGGGIVGEVVEVCEVGYGNGSEMFEMMNGEAIRADGTRVTTVPDGTGDEMGGER